MASGHRIVLDENRIERGESLSGTISAPDGPYTLAASDRYGREVHRTRITVKGKAAAFAFTPLLAVSVRHTLALLSAKGRRVADAAFEVAPRRFKWDDYRVIVWARYPDGFYEILREHGIESSMAYRGNDFSTLVSNDFQFYVEQVASSWLAYYHRSGIPNWTELFRTQKEAYRKHRPRPGKGLHHTSCLSRAQTSKQMERRIAGEVIDHRFYGPLYYTMSDEAGITDLTTPLDLCFAPACLKRFRRFLRESYGSLGRLNRQWGAHFKSWEKVVPSTADQVLLRADGNYSSWADHRAFMDIVLAEAFRFASDVTRKYDPDGLSGIEGGQMPACYGGYDWWRLGGACDVYEIYDIGENCEIMRSLHPDKIMLKAVFPQGTEWDILRVWYEFLHGDMGLILWDNGEPKARWVHPNKEPAEHTANLAPTFHELKGGVAKLLGGAEALVDPIGILYSQASIRAAWIREAEEDAGNGADWLDQGSAYGRLHSEHLRVREAFGRVIEDLGFQYRYAAYEQVAKSLDPAEYKVFFLPQSAALSEAEVKRLKRYVEKGGVLVADALAGTFDEHVKRRKEGALDALFGIKRTDAAYHPLEGQNTVLVNPNGPFSHVRKGTVVPLPAAEPGVKAAGAKAAGDCGGIPCLFYRKVGKGWAVYLNLAVAPYARLRLEEGDPGSPLRGLFSSVFAAARLKPATPVSFDGPGIEVRRFRDGGNLYLTFMKNPHLRVRELGGEETADNEHILEPIRLKADLGKQYHVYDLRRGRYLGRRRTVDVRLGSAEPAILSLLPGKCRGIETAPSEVRAGSMVHVKGRVLGGRAGRRVVHAELELPDGGRPWYYRWNLEAPGGRVTLDIPFAVNAVAGRYRLHLRDVSTGTRSTLVLRLNGEAK